MIPVVVVFPVKQHTPACAVRIAGFGDDIEVTRNQHCGLIEVVRILVHQTTIREGVAGRQLGFLFSAPAEVFFGVIMILRQLI